MIQLFRRPWAVAPAVLAAALLSTACSKAQQAIVPPTADKPASAPVAIVDGTPISHDAYDAYLKGLTRGKPAAELSPEEKSQVLDQLISMQLLSAQASKDGMDKDADVAARVQVLRLQVLADAEAQKYLKGVVPTDAELHAEYDSEVAAMDKTEFHARHILVAAKDKELAEQLTKKIKGGAKFEDLAKANSIDPGSKPNGGDLGWFSLTRMVKPFGDAVKGLKKGDVTAAPVETQYGWHIIKLEDSRDVQQQTFEQFNKQQLANGVIQKKFAVYLDGLKKTAKIEKKLT